MKYNQEQKVTIMLRPQLKDNGDFANNTCMDIAGAGEAWVDIHVGDTDVAVGSTDEASPPILEECDTVNGDYTEIDGAELAAVIGATDDNKTFRIDVPNLPGRKRYIRVKAPHAADGTNGANLCIIGTVAKMDIGPASASDRGLAAHIIS